jgi:glycosyltransferase involved in cell wall biosynthesis
MLPGMATGFEQPRAGETTRPAPELVSVVMPVRNGARHIADQLAALARQTYAADWELVVVDDCCADASVAIVERWRERLPAVRVVRTFRPRGLNHARNVGAGAARGELLAFCDADDVVVPGWLEALVSTAGSADLVGGAMDLETLNDASIREWRPAETLTDLPVGHEFMRYVPGGNCAIWADVAHRIGWNESYRFGESDREFAWRAQLAGYRLAFAPTGVVQQRYRSGVAATVRQHLRYGVGGPHLYRDFRRHGMRSPGLDGAVDVWKWLARNAPDLFRSPEQRGHWLRRASVAAGRLVGSARWRTFFP